MHRVGDGLHHYTWKETGEEREDFEERREGRGWCNFYSMFYTFI